MGSGKGRRGSGASLVVSANSPHRLDQHEAEGGWSGRVKMLAPSTLSAAAREEGGRTIALTEEDFRKSGFRARESVAVLAGPSRLIVGRISPLPSAALRPGGIGLAPASARSLECEDGARVRVRRLSSTSVAILPASAVDLVLEPGLPGRAATQASQYAYLDSFTAGRRALLNRAAGFCAQGVHMRDGDLLSVSFEGVPHTFRVARLRPSSRRRPATAMTTIARVGQLAGAAAVAEKGNNGDIGDALAAPLASLLISEPSPVVKTAAAASLPDPLAEGTIGNLSRSHQEEVESNATGKPHTDNSDRRRGASPATGQSLPCRTARVGGKSQPWEATAPSAANVVYPRESPAKSSIVDGGVEGADSAGRAWLEAFYRERNPEKLEGIDAILAKYAGREGELFTKLTKKYGGVGSSLIAATPPSSRHLVTTTTGMTTARGGLQVGAAAATAVVAEKGEGVDNDDALATPMAELSISGALPIDAAAAVSAPVTPAETTIEKLSRSQQGDDESRTDSSDRQAHAATGITSPCQTARVGEESKPWKATVPSAANLAHVEESPAKASVVDGGTDSAGRAWLEAFYREHNPEKMEGIDAILAKYAGREGELFAKLMKKYGGAGSSLRTATSGGNTGRERQQGEPGAPAPDPASPLSPPPPSGRGRKAEGKSPAPSSQRLAVETPDRGGASGVRSWGSGETLWFISTETSIELSAADAPCAEAGGTPEGRSQQGNTGITGPEISRQDVKDGVEVNSDEWGSVGGLSPQIEQLREAIQLPLRSPEVLRRYGVRPPRGVLLHGPPGTGKTTLARAAAKACGCHVIVVNGSELMSRFVGESEGALRKTFAEASRRAPCLIVFDEVDTLCPRRDQASSEAQRRVVSTMLALLDGVDAQDQVVVIACTNRPQALDPALRRPGRLDSEVEIGVPDAAGRAEVLRVLLRGVPHTMAETKTPSGGEGGAGQGAIKEIADRTHGFVGADLQLLVKEAALQALRRTRGDWTAVSHDASRAKGGSVYSRAPSRSETRVGRPGEGLPTLTPADFHAALPMVSPSGLREVAVEVPSVKWGDIGGMEGVKQSLREVVEWPLRHPEAFERMGMSPPRGVLLYGPPGCSKTLMARALATESGMNFLAVKGPELLSKWLGESERAMQALFKRARAAAPTIIFFDEVDALACKRGGGGEGGAGATERVLTQLLTELDGIQPVKRLVVVAATNRPDVIDPALLRPGRLDRLVYVPPPDLPSRREILRISLAKAPCAGDVDPEEIALRTKGFSGAEVVALCREASICALEEDRSATQVQHEHLLEALGHMKPQITPSVLASYASFQGGGV